MTSRNIT